MANYQVIDAYGSVITIQSSIFNSNEHRQIIGASIIGTAPIAISKNVASVYGASDVGAAVWGLRNDTLASIVGVDNNYTPFAVGPSGEQITANAPLTKWVQGTATLVSGSSVQALAPQGTSIFTYVTAVQVRNDSANNVGITFTGGLGGASSVLGYTVAPANGGSNITYPNGLKTGANSGFSASISGVASIYMAVQGFISKI
jgi:hypothetical protein